MRTGITVFAALLCIALGGCSKSPEPPAETQLQPEDTVVGDQIRALDKARSVEETLKQDAQQTQETLDRQDAAGR